MLQYFLRGGCSDEAVDVDVDEGGHEELAVEPVHDATVAGNDVTEILEWNKKMMQHFIFSQHQIALNPYPMQQSHNVNCDACFAS